MNDGAGPEIETNSPLSVANIEHVLGVMDLAPSQRVIDVGCGNGAILVRAAEQKGISGVGIDVDANAVAAAVEMARQRGVAERLTFHVADASTFPFDASFDAALCIGSCHALGGYRAALTSLRRAVRPNGFVAVGELYWKREPAAEYLAVLGEAKSAREDHAGNARIGAEEGLELVFAAVSSVEEWDRFEGRHWQTTLVAKEGAAVNEPTRDRMRRWRDAYLRWGWETLGFGVYVFQKIG